MDTVWVVDDLPRNLRKFEENHSESFKVETFSKIDEVLDRIHKKDYPDALLCDVFFYDSVEEAERVETEIEKLAEQLKKTAQKIGVHDHRHAVGIQLMKKIYEFFGNKAPPFPMYAYTSKGWNNEQVHGGDVRCVVAQEGAPSLRRRAASLDHVLRHAGLSDLEAKLEQLAMDARRTPQRIFGAQPEEFVLTTPNWKKWPATRSGSPR